MKTEQRRHNRLLITYGDSLRAKIVTGTKISMRVKSRVRAEEIIGKIYKTVAVYIDLDKGTIKRTSSQSIIESAVWTSGDGQKFKIV